jgi:hypothetical protein
VTQSRPGSPRVPQCRRFPRLWGKPAGEATVVAGENSAGVLAFNDYMPEFVCRVQE